jgi:2-methylcitrate dehydratase PrpD
MSASPRTGRDAGVLLAEHFARTGFNDLPATTVERTKLVILDTLGAALAATDAEGCRELHGLVTRWGGAAESGLIGHPERVPAHNAALLNATLARALELDEVHEAGLTHSVATVLPVALATADLVGGVGGRELLTAVALGADAGIRLSMAPVTDLGGEGYHPRSMSRTYQTGTLAGSLTAAKVARVDLETMHDAFGIAYSQCAGNLQGLAEGTLTVRVQQGICAQSAVLALDLARAGISGTRESLEGKYGWFQAFWGGRYDLEPLLGGLGTRYEVEEISIKPYACCKYGHNSIAAAVEVTEDPAFALERVRAISVDVYSKDCWDLVCEPLSLKASPAALAADNGWTLAQFSLPYMVACALVRGKLTTDELATDVRTDASVLDVLAKVQVVMDDQTRGLAELPEPGHVMVELDDGTRIERTVRRASGHPDRPMTVEQQIDKFRWCTRGVAGDRVERIVELVLDLEHLDDTAALGALLAGSA